MDFELKEKRKNLLLQLLREHGLSMDQAQVLKTSSSSDVIRWQLADDQNNEFKSEKNSNSAQGNKNAKNERLEEKNVSYKVWKIFSLVDDFANIQTGKNKDFSSSRSEFIRSSNVLEFWNGVGCVKLLNCERGVQTLEYLEGQDHRSVSNKSSQISIWVDVANQLHSICLNQQIQAKLPNMRAWFSSLEKISSQKTDPAWKAAWNAFLELQAGHTKDLVLHGDLHHENIRFSKRGWLALDPKGLLGDAALEAAVYFYNPIPRSQDLRRAEHIQETSQKLADGLKVDSKKLLSYAYAFGFLSASWMLEDGENPAEILQISEAIRRCMP